MSNTSKKFSFRFGDLIEREELAGRLIRMIEAEDGGGHCLLLTGPEGIGKKSLAYPLAARLLCADLSDNSQDACGVCDSCRYLEAGTHPDFVRLERGEDRGIKIDSVRAEVVRDLPLKPQIAARKVYLIDADDLNEQGQNALLKSLEEPPPYAVFILLAERPEELLETIRSRSTEITVPPLSPDAVRAIIAPLAKSPEEREFAVQFANGNPGMAMRLVDDSSFPEFRRETILRLLNLTKSGRIKVLTEDYDFMNDNRDRLDQILRIWQSVLRDLLIVERAPHDLMHSDYREPITQVARHLARKQDAPGALVHAYEAIDEFRDSMQVNTSFEVAAGQLLLTLRKALHI